MVKKAARRRWLRFSFRSLLVFVTLFCIYCATWQPTRNRGVQDVEALLTARNDGNPVTTEAIAPLLVRHGITELHSQSNKLPKIVTDYSYYFACFGFVVKLPFTTTHDQDMQLPPNQLEFQGFLIRTSAQPVE